VKMLSGLTSSEFTERLAYGALLDGRWRKHLKSVRERLARAHQSAAQGLIELGFELFCEPKAGLFLWARHPGAPSAAELSYRAAEHDIMLGPGHLFSTDLTPSPWLRFNVAFCTDGAVFSYLRGEGLTPGGVQEADQPPRAAEGRPGDR